MNAWEICTPTGGGVWGNDLYRPDFYHTDDLASTFEIDDGFLGMYYR